MSQYSIRIIPANINSSVSDSKIQKTLHFLNQVILTEKIDVIRYDFPTFIDCGSNLEKIECPHCKKTLDFDWWGDAMEFSSNNNFSNLYVVTPCCSFPCSLNELEYECPCGFAFLEFKILNPTSELTTRALNCY